MNNWQKILVSGDIPILDAMKIIDQAGTQFVMVVDKDLKLLGVVTDGDIRRGILKKISLDSPVEYIMNTDPKTLSKGTSKKESARFLKDNMINHAPVIDDSRKVISLFSIIDETVEIENTAVLMVGGLGSRLGDLTSNCPKPLLPIGGRPVLEIIVENLRDHGFRDFIFCVNYKAEMIQSHFGNGSSFGITIRYVHENKRMGTAGALTLLPEIGKGPFLVMNGDIVTKVNFTRMLDYHKDNPVKATMAVRKYDFQIPYGVVRQEQGVISEIEEKPIQSFLVSAGIYFIEPACLKFIPKDAYFDMPQLFQAMIQNKEKTQAFPIHEYWIDIGKEDDLQRAHDDMAIVDKEI